MYEINAVEKLNPDPIYESESYSPLLQRNLIPTNILSYWNQFITNKKET